MILSGKLRPTTHQSLRQLDAFGRIHRTISLIMLPLGMVACLTLWFTEWSVSRVVTLDTLALPLIAIGMGVATVSVWVKPGTLAWFERAGFLALSAYLLLALQHELRDFLPIYGHLNGYSYWFFITFLLAFIGWKPRSALFLSAGVYVIMLILLAINLKPLLALGATQRLLALSDVAQFYLACLIYIVAHFVLSQLRPQLAEMQRLALTDPLTGIANRRRAEELLSQELSRAGRYDRPLSVILFDLDHFKRINDLNGHAVGDAVLRSVTRVVGHELRTTDHLTRWGGEEFLIIAPELGGSRASQVAERMRARIAQLRIPGSQDTAPTASFGVALYRPGETPHDLVDRADEALYMAKHEGRNRVVMERPRTTLITNDTPSMESA